MQIIRRPREDVVVPRDILMAGLSVGALGLWVRTEASRHIPLNSVCLSEAFNIESLQLADRLVAELVAAGIWELKK
jgi:hypothetical protein